MPVLALPPQPGEESGTRVRDLGFELGLGLELRAMDREPYIGAMDGTCRNLIQLHSGAQSRARGAAVESGARGGE